MDSSILGAHRHLRHDAAGVLACARRRNDVTCCNGIDVPQHGPWGLCSSMTSSIKPEVRNVSQRLRSIDWLDEERTTAIDHIGLHKRWRTSGVYFRRYAREQMHSYAKQTDKRIAILCSPTGGGVNMRCDTMATVAPDSFTVLSHYLHALSTITS